MADGMKFTSPFDPPQSCVSCTLGSGRARNVYSEPKRSTKLLELVHTDLAGPFEPNVRGHQYYIVIVDDYTRFTWAFPMRFKAEAWYHLSTWMNYMVNQHPHARIQRLRCDNGGEYISNRGKDYCRQAGIYMEPTDPYTPSQNGVSERANLTFWNRIRAILHDSGLPHAVWDEVLATVVYIKNRTPTIAIDSMSPYEALHGIRPNLSHLARIGSLAYKLVPKAIHPKKLDHRRVARFLLGYEGTNQYRIWNAETGAVERASEVIFDENVTLASVHAPRIMLPSISSTEVAPPCPELVLPLPYINDLPHFDLPLQMTSPAGENVEWQVNPLQNQTSHSALHGISNKSISTESTSKDLPKGYAHLAANVLTALQDGQLPSIEEAFSLGLPEPNELKTYQEALDSFDQDKWTEAMLAEIKSLMENKTWTLVDPTKLSNIHVLRGKWVFKLKRNAEGLVTKFKARWVVRGFEQQMGVDYSETFAAVVKPMSYKALFAIAAARDYDIEQMDVITAFLYGDITDLVYVEQPTGFKDKDKPLYVCRLNKALYGLKQAPRIWYETLKSALNTFGFEAIDNDTAVFIKGNTIIIAYVDDLLIIGPNPEDIKTVKLQLQGKFKMTDLGAVSYFLGIKVTRNRKDRVIRLSQEAYAKEILERFGFPKGIHPRKTPMEVDAVGLLVPAPAEYEAPPADKLRYQEMIGCLMYLMLSTRPDLCFCISLLSRFSANPTSTHAKHLKNVFRYLAGTTTLGLVYRGDEILTGWTDAEWGAEKSASRSVGGYIYLLAGAAISWSSKRQTTVALSSCEAEYTALHFAVREAIWLRRLLQDFAVAAATSAIKIFCDNQSAIALAKNPQFHQRTKHIRLQYHFTRQAVQEDEVEIEYVPTERQLADILTKPLGQATFERLRAQLGLRFPHTEFTEQEKEAWKGTKREGSSSVGGTSKKRRTTAADMMVEG